MKSPDDSKQPSNLETGFSNYKSSLEQQGRFDLLKRVIDILEKKSVKYSVVGGYGLDGLHGELTRDHDDIDIIVGSEDMEQTRILLSNIGFQRQKDKPSGLEVYFHNLTKTKLELADLKLVKYFFDGDEKIIMPQTANGTLAGILFKVATLGGQKILRDIQSKRLGGKGPNMAHDEKIIDDLKTKT